MGLQNRTNDPCKVTNKTTKIGMKMALQNRTNDPCKVTNKTTKIGMEIVQLKRPKLMDSVQKFQIYKEGRSRQDKKYEPKNKVYIDRVCIAAIYSTPTRETNLTANKK